MITVHWNLPVNFPTYILSESVINVASSSTNTELSEFANSAKFFSPTVNLRSEQFTNVVNLVPYVKTKDLPAVANEPRRMVTEMPVISPGEPPTSCAGCGGHIADRYYLQAVDRQWHGSCLTCHSCKAQLDNELSCFYKDGHIYCKEDYYR